MRDLHNHLLFGIDDGSTSIDESIKLLNEMEKSKVTDIMLTPHYIAGSDYCTPNSKKRELIEELKKQTNINLYLGNEVYIDNNIVADIRNDKISTLNGSRYVLIEFPLNEKLETEYRKASAGRIAEVLFETKEKIGENEYYVGYTKEYIRAAVPAEDEAGLCGNIVKVRLIEDLEGEIMLATEC